MGSLLLLAALQAATGPDPGGTLEPIDTTRLTALRQFTNNTGWHRQGSTAGPDGAQVVTMHNVRSTACAPRIHYGLHGWAGLDAGVTAKWTLVVDGAAHPVLWSGQHEVHIPMAAQGMTSDPLPPSVVMRAGTTIYSVMDIKPGSVYPDRTFKQPTRVSHRAETAFVSLPDAMTSSLLSGAPVGLYGLTEPTEMLSVAHIGDSFSEPGWARNAYETHGLAWSDMSQWAEGTPASGLPERRFPTTGPMPYRAVVTAYGGNNRGITPLESQQAVHIGHWRGIANTGALVGACTLHPYTSSTDNWASVEGQTKSLSEEVEGVRVARNEWLRDGAPLLPDDTPLPVGTTDPAALRAGDDGHPLAFPVFDQSAACETAVNSGIWKADGGAWTADGAHLTQHGSDMLQTHFEQWVADTLT